MLLHFSSSALLLATVVSFNLPMQGNAATELKPTPKMQQEIVDAHNSLRSSIDNAADMQRIVWNNKLADLALEWAKQCKFDRRSQAQLSNVANFSKVGENIYAVSEKTPAFDAQNIVEEWYAEYNAFKYPNSCAKDANCSHFTQVAWSRTCSVGCAAAVCDKIAGFKDASGKEVGGLLAVCNYGPAGNDPPDAAPWKRGKECSACAVAGPCVNGLCTPECPDPYTVTLGPNAHLCVDQHPLCKFWQEKGHCTSNAGYMIKHCVASCTGCDPRAILTWKCLDQSANCPQWVQSGQCQANPDYMSYFCATSCEFCDPGSGAQQPLIEWDARRISIRPGGPKPRVNFGIVNRGPGTVASNSSPGTPASSGSSTETTRGSTTASG